MQSRNCLLGVSLRYLMCLLCEHKELLCCSSECVVCNLFFSTICFQGSAHFRHTVYSPFCCDWQHQCCVHNKSHQVSFDCCLWLRQPHLCGAPEFQILTEFTYTGRTSSVWMSTANIFPAVFSCPMLPNDSGACICNYNSNG